MRAFQILPQSSSSPPSPSPPGSWAFSTGLLLCSQGRTPVLPRGHSPPGHQEHLLFRVALLSLGSNSRTNCPSSLSLSSHLVGKQGVVSSLSGVGLKPTNTQFVQGHQGGQSFEVSKGNGSTGAQNKGSQPRLGRENCPEEVIFD